MIEGALTRCSASFLILNSLLCFFWLVDQCAANCYWLDGTDVNAWWNVSDLYYYQPCHNDTASNATAASMCCATGPGRVADGNADRCVGNGLCYSDALGLYWRESCTDQTWESPACIKLFVNGTNNGTDAPLIACPDGSWCLDNIPNNQGCCAAGNGFVITRDGTVTQHNGSAVSSSSDSSSSSTATLASPTSSPTSSTPSTTSTPVSASKSPSSSSRSLSLGAEAGIGVGVALAAVALLLGGYIFLRNARRTPSMKDVQQAHEMDQPPPPAEMQDTHVYTEIGPPQRTLHKGMAHEYNVGSTTTPAQLE